MNVKSKDNVNSEASLSCQVKCSGKMTIWYLYNLYI